MTETIYFCAGFIVGGLLALAICWGIWWAEQKQEERYRGNHD